MRNEFKHILKNIDDDYLEVCMLSLIEVCEELGFFDLANNAQEIVNSNIRDKGRGKFYIEFKKMLKLEDSVDFRRIDILCINLSKKYLKDIYEVLSKEDINKINVLRDYDTVREYCLYSVEKVLDGYLDGIPGVLSVDKAFKISFKNYLFKNPGELKKLTKARNDLNLKKGSASGIFNSLKAIYPPEVYSALLVVATGRCEDYFSVSHAMYNFIGAIKSCCVFNSKYKLNVGKCVITSDSYEPITKEANSYFEDSLAKIGVSLSEYKEYLRVLSTVIDISQLSPEDIDRTRNFVTNLDDTIVGLLRKDVLTFTRYGLELNYNEFIFKLLCMIDIEPEIINYLNYNVEDLGRLLLQSVEDCRHKIRTKNTYVDNIKGRRILAPAEGILSYAVPSVKSSKGSKEIEMLISEDMDVFGTYVVAKSFLDDRFNCIVVDLKNNQIYKLGSNAVLSTVLSSSLCCRTVVYSERTGGSISHISMKGMDVDYKSPSDWKYKNMINTNIQTVVPKALRPNKGFIEYGEVAVVGGTTEGNVKEALNRIVDVRKGERIVNLKTVLM